MQPLTEAEIAALKRDMRESLVEMQAVSVSVVKFLIKRGSALGVNCSDLLGG